MDGETAKNPRLNDEFLPKFGVNAKEIIIREALITEDSDDDDSDSSKKDERPEIIALQQGPRYLSALSRAQLPLAPFVLRPKLPRIFRNTLLQKLTGEHLALLAAQKGWIPPSEAANDEDLIKQAVEIATSQESSLYGKAKSGQVYQNMAARTNALQWPEEKAEERRRPLVVPFERDTTASPSVKRMKRAPVVPPQKAVPAPVVVVVSPYEEAEFPEPDKRTQSSTGGWQKVKQEVEDFITDHIDVAIAAGTLEPVHRDTVRNKCIKKLLARHLGEKSSSFLVDEREAIIKLIEDYSVHIFILNNKKC